MTDSTQAVRNQLLTPPPGGLLSGLEVIHDGSFCAIVGEVRRSFMVTDGVLQLIKISATELELSQRAADPERWPVSRAALVTLFVMERVAGKQPVQVCGLQPDGRAFWDRIQAKGWVKRVDAGPSESRDRTVRLTDGGRRIIAEHAPTQANTGHGAWWRRLRRR